MAFGLLTFRAGRARLHMWSAHIGLLATRDQLLATLPQLPRPFGTMGPMAGAE